MKKTRAKRTTSPRKASGRNIPDAERNTEKITLRLDPDDAATLRGIAHAWRCSIGEVVSTALAALHTNAASSEATRIAHEIEQLGPEFAESGIVQTVLRERVKQERRRAKR